MSVLVLVILRILLLFMIREWHLFYTRTVIPRKAPIDFESRNLNLTQLLPIDIFGLGSHAGDGEDLLVFLHTLLEFAEQHSETYSCKCPVRFHSLKRAASMVRHTSGITLVRRPEGRREAGHDAAVLAWSSKTMRRGQQERSWTIFPNSKEMEM